MKIISRQIDFQIPQNTAVAIGKFDGVHRGHKKLLDAILAHKMDDLASCVFTFSPSPSIFRGQGNEKELTTQREKREIFEAMGVEYLVEFPFTKETAAILPEDFIRDILYHRMNVRFLAAGNDISFGKGGTGNASLILSLAHELHFEAAILEKVRFCDQPISSSWIRLAVESGDMELAAAMLGEPYQLWGSCQNTARSMTTMDPHIVSIAVEPNKILPTRGWYQVWVSTKEELFQTYVSVANTDDSVSDQLYLYYPQEQTVPERELKISFIRTCQNIDGFIAPF
ncbi:MAG: FAD synthetase family protein [Lachnospiraceae bacterium]|nr:FAD synthetase family protein [Lachnospiraceae bacterium]